MAEIFNKEWLKQACLGFLSRRACGAGDLTRRLIGGGMLPNDETSYADVKAVLAELLEAGEVTKAGNGKAVHYRVVSRG